MPTATPEPLAPPDQAVLEAAEAHWKTCFGIASCSELSAALANALRERHSDARVAKEPTRELERCHVARYGRAALSAEYADDSKRVHARGDSAALVRYVDQWTRKIAYRQRAHAARWAVPGLSPDEVRDALSLRLWEVLAADTATELGYCSAGREWGLRVLVQELRSLRQRFRLAAISVDFWTTPVPERAPNQEESWLEFEAEICRALAHGRALRRLTAGQEAWLAAFEAAASGGGFFRASQSLNLSIASRALGKNRSSAVRAYRQLEHEFQRELERFE